MALGETLVSILPGSDGAEVIAEDLGVDSAVRPRIDDAPVGSRGFKVLRWERHWDQPGTPLIDPRELS